MHIYNYVFAGGDRWKNVFDFATITSFAGHHVAEVHKRKSYSIMFAHPLFFAEAYGSVMHTHPLYVRVNGWLNASQLQKTAFEHTTSLYLGFEDESPAELKQALQIVSASGTLQYLTIMTELKHWRFWDLPERGLDMKEYCPIHAFPQLDTIRLRDWSQQRESGEGHDLGIRRTLPSSHEQSPAAETGERRPLRRRTRVGEKLHIDAPGRSPAKMRSKHPKKKVVCTKKKVCTCEGEREREASSERPMMELTVEDDDESDV